MKTCQICHSLAFDDAQVCYGCMHPFSKEEPIAAPTNKNREGGVPSRFVVTVSPTVKDGQTVWGCSVEPVAS